MIPQSRYRTKFWCILERTTRIHQNLTFRDVDIEVARRVATGELHPMTKKPLGLPEEGKENATVFPVSLSC
jgi:hypothetical protein